MTITITMLKIIFFIAILIGIVDYVLRARAIWALANRRMISHSWMAWVPVLSSLTMGRLAKQYDQKLGQKRNWDIALLIPAVLLVLGAIICVIVMFSMLDMEYIVQERLRAGAFTIRGSIWFFINFIMHRSFLFFLGAMSVVLFGLCWLLHTLCIYKIFESTVPTSALSCTILNFLIPPAGALCLLSCRNKGYAVHLGGTAETTDKVESVRQSRNYQQ